MNDVFILSAARTPVGTFLGALAPLSASRLGAVAIKAALDRAEVPASTVGQVWMGNVLQAGQGQAPARQAALAADIPVSTGCITVHKVCGSGMRSVMDAANALRAGEFELALAGGMESMSNAPYLLLQGRSGMRMGYGQLLDAMLSDGLWDPYKNVHMGTCAELCAAKYSFTREAQDAYALESYQRARRANEAGDFNAEFAPVTIEGKKGPVTVVHDGARRGGAEGRREGGDSAFPDRPLRGERGVRRRGDGVHRGPRARPEQSERERRGRGPRPSDRFVGVAHRDDARARPSSPQEEVRPRRDLHRGRRSHGPRRRSALESGL